MVRRQVTLGDHWTAHGAGVAAVARIRSWCSWVCPPPSAHEVLDCVAEMLYAYSEIHRVWVIGTTDDSGDAQVRAQGSSHWFAGRNVPLRTRQPTVYPRGSISLHW